MKTRKFISAVNVVASTFRCNASQIYTKVNISKKNTRKEADSWGLMMRCSLRWKNRMSSNPEQTKRYRKSSNRPLDAVRVWINTMRWKKTLLQKSYKHPLDAVRVWTKKMKWNQTLLCVEAIVWQVKMHLENDSRLSKKFNSWKLTMKIFIEYFLEVKILIAYCACKRIVI